MIARAPGKVVLSGAYAVLEGAPALVTAIDRYVTADSSKPAEFITDEIREALAAGTIPSAPHFDASSLREAGEGGTSRKLGLGSSAAILVASLAARLGPTLAEPSDDALRALVFPRALAAHRAAQRGGSGIDVAASVHGGLLVARLRDTGELDVASHVLPPGTVIEVFSSRHEAVTRVMLERVKAFSALDPPHYRQLLARASTGARAAARATAVAELVRALSEQIEALSELGRASGAGIVPDALTPLRQLAAAESASFGPAGAGGGDTAIFVGPAPSSPTFRMAADAAGLTLLAARIGARGVHLDAV